VDYLEFLVRAEAVWVGGDDPWPSPSEIEKSRRMIEIMFGSREK